jgi:hypothetical protein
LTISACSCSNGIGFGSLPRALRDRREALPGEPGHAAVLVLRRAGELAQAFRRMHMLRRVQAQLGALGAERQLDQPVLIANAGHGDAAPFGVGRAVRHIGADRIGAVVRLEQRHGARVVRRSRKRVTERSRQGNPDGRIRFGCPRAGERRKVGASIRGGHADLRRGI